MIEERFGVLDLDVTAELLDVTDAEQAAEVIGRHKPGALVNNAGDATFAPLLEVDDDEARDQLELLVVAPMRLARLAAEAMRKRGDGGRIVVVSSALATVPFPSTGWYSGSKAALSSLTDTLRVELAEHGIRVVRVELGAIDTPVWETFLEATGLTDVVERREELRALIRAYGGLVKAAAREWLVRGTLTREQVHIALSTTLLSLVRDAGPRIQSL